MTLVIKIVHDHPLYLLRPDMLTLVEEPLSADGVVHRITYSLIYFRFIY